MPRPQPATSAGSGPGGRRATGRTLGERQRQRRDAMVAAAYDLIGTRGFAQTKVVDVCRRAGVSARNFYEEFDDRDDLLTAVGEYLVAAIFAVWSSPVRGADGGRESPTATATARSRVTAVVRAFADDPRLGRVAFVEAVGVSTRHEERRRELLDVFPAWIEAYAQGRLDDAGVPRGRQRAMAVAAFAAAHELLARWSLEPEGERRPADELVDDVMAVTAAILAPT
jgi:AcrR family transcriptional regulator